MRSNFLNIICFLLLISSTSTFGLSNDTSNHITLTDTDIYNQVNTLSESCWDLREEDSDSALVLGLMALDLAEQNNITDKIGKISNYVGVIYHLYMYRYKESIPYFHKALENSILIRDSLQTAYAYNNLGDVYLVSGNIPLALQYGKQSLQISQQIKNQTAEAYAYTNLGEVYREKGDYKLSLFYLSKAAKINHEIDPSSRKGYSLYNQAKTYAKSGDYESAMSYYHRSLECSIGTLNLRYVSWCLNGIADIYLKQGNYDMASEYYNKAINWNKKQKTSYSIIDNYIGLAMVCAHKNEINEGEKLLDKALQLSLKLDINSQIIKAYNSYIDFYKITNNHNKLIKSFDIFLSEYDSILTIQQFDIVDVLEKNYVIQQDLLEKEQELQSNSSQKIRLIIIIAFMCIVIVVLIFIYRSHKKLNIQLEKTNKTKDKLFSVISHDLKNPFNTLIGFSKIVQTEIKNENYDQALKHSGYLNNAAVEGFNLVTNLLHWSLSQSGKIQFNPQDTNFDAFIKEIEELFIPQSEKYNVILLFINTVKSTILVDPNIIKIILVNLITNAFKYTEENESITFTSFLENSILKIEIKDTGIGMSKDTLDKLLDNTCFSKSRKGLRKEKGTGLGLSIVTELIQIHKGSIKVESEEGKGTTFNLEFPTNLRQK